jgi:hypothetical protein
VESRKQQHVKTQYIALHFYFDLMKGILDWLGLDYLNVGIDGSFNTYRKFLKSSFFGQFWILGCAGCRVWG